MASSSLGPAPLPAQRSSAHAQQSSDPAPFLQPCPSATSPSPSEHAAPRRHSRGRVPPRAAPRGPLHTRPSRRQGTLHRRLLLALTRRLLAARCRAQSFSLVPTLPWCSVTSMCPHTAPEARWASRGTGPVLCPGGSAPRTPAQTSPRQLASVRKQLPSGCAWRRRPLTAK